MTTMPEDTPRRPVNDKILERIKKLLRLAENSGATPDEAATAAAHAAAYMRKYNLENSDLIALDLEEDDAIVSELVDVGEMWRANRVPAWFDFLGVKVGQLFDCEVRYSTLPRKIGGRSYVGFRYYGYKTDVTVANWTLVYLYKTVNRLTENWWSAAGIKGHPNAKGLKTSYRMGASRAIREKMTGMIAAKKREEKASTISTALVVAKAAAIHAKFGDFNYRHRDVSEVYQSAYDQGKEDGRHVSINTPIAGSGNAGNLEGRLLLK